MIPERDAAIIALEDQRNRALTESVEKSVLLAQKANEIESLKAQLDEANARIKVLEQGEKGDAAT